MASINVRHQKGCPAGAKASKRKCSCAPGYQVRIKPDGRSGKPITKTFRNRSEAESWRAHVELQKRKGMLGAKASSETLRQAGQRLIRDMRAGVALTREGGSYKLRTIDSYESSLERDVYPVLGNARLRDVRLRDVQRLVDQMLRDGSNPSTIRNAVNPLRVIYNRAVRSEDVSVNPCDHLQMPAVRTAAKVALPPEMIRKCGVGPNEARVIPSCRYGQVGPYKA